MAVTIKTTQHGNSYCPQVQFVVEFVSETGSTASYNWALKWVTFGYTVSSSASKAYTAKIDGVTVASGSFAIGGKTTQVIKSGTYTINKDTSSRTVPISLSFDMTFTWSGTSGGTKTASGSFSVGAKSSYTVSYNANGGSGAPSAQTKWYGTNLTLSSSKPSRTGYTFLHWCTNTANTGTWYNPGATYSSNSAVTLYAIWQANTYTVSYNANGGSGAPSSQTKTYGVNLTLSSTKPTRTNYNFLGWSTSASGGVVYAAGGTYTANSGVTLYAVWQLAYKKPRISGFNAYRCDSTGNASETGTYIKVTFNWATDYAVTLVKVEWKTQSGGSWSSANAYGEPTASAIVGDGGISIETSYHVRAYVSDSGGTTYSTTASIGTTKFPIDVKAGGTGVAIGKVAEYENLFEVGLPAKFLDSIHLGDNIANNPTWNTYTNSNVDYNNYTKSGTYYMGSGCTNAPNNRAYVRLFVSGYNAQGDILQIAGCISQDEMYYRASANSIWRDWKRINLVGEPISGSINRGSWNVPTKGLITQVTDNSGGQHSAIVGLKSDGKTRLYGMDLLDSDTSPAMRLYSGSDYLQIGYGEANMNGYDLAKIFGSSITASNAGNKSYIKLGPLKMSWGKISITPVVNTDTKGSVTFPITYTTVPAIFLTSHTGSPSICKGVGATNMTTTGFDVFLYRSNTTVTNIMWFAIGD